MVKVIKSNSHHQVLSRTQEDKATSFSFLSIADQLDGLPVNYEEDQSFIDNVSYLTTHDGIKIGFVLNFVIKEMQNIGASIFDDIFDLCPASQQLRFRSSNFDDRNKHLDIIAKLLYEKSTLEGIKGWRDEKYTVWASGQPYVLLERAMAGLMGIITYGAHINGYVIDRVTGEIKFWIPRRAATKPTWPLMLDNIIAGGISSGYGVYDTVLKESLEEANLSEEVINSNIKSAGVVSYFHFMPKDASERFKDESSFIVGEVEYIYDLELPVGITPSPNDGEVDSFNLLSLQETIDALVKGEFKPNCGLIMVDFLIRHGYITAENEPNFLRLVTKMHRSLPFPTAT